MKAHFLIFLICFVRISYGQGAIDIVEGPLHLMDCDSSCVMLHANFPKPLHTNTYSISSIPFAPSTIAGTAISLNDDKFSNAIPLGFNFCFFENTYSSCYVADNGVLTFNSNYANTSCFNNGQQVLPFFNSTCPDNAVFFMFMDIAPSLGGTITYSTIGTAPNRKFVVNYQNVKLFGATCSNTTSSYQVVLNESTNIIEVFITNKQICDSNPSNAKNYATVGIQNIGATTAYTATGKSASIFTSTNEGIKIAPSGVPDYIMRWKNANGTVIANNVDSIHFCPNSIPYHKVTAEISLTCPTGFYTDTVALIKNGPTITGLNIVQPLCTNSPTGSVIINGTTTSPPLTYRINGLTYTSSNTFSNLPSGTYTATIKDANGCTHDTLFTINPIYNITLIVDTIVKPICPLNNGSATVHATGGTPAYNYTWSNGATGQTINNVAPGAYTVIVVDANGCSQSMVVNIVWGGLPQAQVSITEPLCGNSNGSIVLNVSGGTPPYQYLWNNNATTSSLTNIPSGSYNVTVTDINGCSQVLGWPLNDTLSILNAKIIAHTSCGLPNGAVTLVTSGSIAPYSYLWTPSGQTTSTPANLAAGTHFCTTTAANGCTRIDTVVINSSLSTSNVLSIANANCDSSNGVVYVLSVQNGTSPITTLWSNGSNGSVITNLAIGTYWVKTTDNSGCIAIDTIQIFNDGKPKLNVISYTPPNCYGDSTGSVTLSGSSGVPPYKYSIDGINFFSFAQIDNIPGGTYPVYITDANSCLDDTILTFSQPPQIIATYVADTVACFNDLTASVSISAVGGFPPYTYSFNNGTNSTQTNYSNLGKGDYLLVVTDSKNCDESFTVTVEGPQEPLDVVIDKKDVPCFETNTGSVNLSLVGGWEPYQYVWNNSFTGLNIADIGETHTMFSITDARGCQLVKPIDVAQLLCCKAVVPNAFSPNGDTKNDVLRVLPISDVSSVKFSVFNRWGTLMFSTKSLNDSWDGTYKGSNCELDTYFYILEYTCPFSTEKYLEKGDVTLIR